MDDIATEIGAKPNVWSYLFTSPLFWMQLFFGPVYAYQFRLRGPHSWPGARHAIELVELARSLGTTSIGVAAHPAGHPSRPTPSRPRPPHALPLLPAALAPPIGTS